VSSELTRSSIFVLHAQQEQSYTNHTQPNTSSLLISKIRLTPPRSVAGRRTRSRLKTARQEGSSLSRATSPLKSKSLHDSISTSGPADRAPLSCALITGLSKALEPLHFTSLCCCCLPTSSILTMDMLHETGKSPQHLGVLTESPDRRTNHLDTAVVC
jgi:hypothetical protein